MVHGYIVSYGIKSYSSDNEERMFSLKEDLTIIKKNTINATLVYYFLKII